MKYRKPDYFKDFRCIAGECSDTCCSGWEVEVDETTAQIYQQEPGPFGDRLRQELQITPEENYFRLREGRCPFLNNRNMCDIITELGEEKLCDICREHPRFYNWFGNYTEVGLGMCCEAAQKLMFSSPEKMRFIVEEVPEDKEEASDEEELSADECEAMLDSRDGAIFIMQDRNYSIGRRLQHYLDYACRLQEVPNPGVDPKKSKISLRKLITMFSEMESLDETWPDWMMDLEEHLDEVLEKEPEFYRYIRSRLYEYEHISVYLTYRYFPESLFDGKILSKAEFAVSAIILIYLLDVRRYIKNGEYTFEDRLEITRRFSKEIEYCPENMEAFEQYCADNKNSFVEELEGIIQSIRS